MQLDELTLDGYRYDARILATPLEYLHFLSATGKRPGACGPIGMEAIIQQDLEWQVESVALDVHRVVRERSGGPACTCGLVMNYGDVVTSAGHRDLRDWRLAERPYAVSRGQDAAERFAVVCPTCRLGVTAPSLADAHDRRTDHDCDDLGALNTPAELRLHLGLAG
ncbi:hypothetical protein GCM10009844_23920 [Nocardioides koreensis]|uniref:Uncharacterized protein n=1 Tax=Nocardioides koreensis TaxID=433651 RepID=A0ABN2ZT35_9ACTN